MPTNIESPAEIGKLSEGLLSVPEAAAYLRMSPGWLYTSGIPFVRCGRRRRYRRDDLDQFIERHISHKPARRDA